MPASRSTNTMYCAIRWCRTGLITGLVMVFIVACRAPVPPAIPPSDLLTFRPSASLESDWRKSGFAAGRSMLQPLPLAAGLYVAARSGLVQRLDRVTGRVDWSERLGRTLGAGVGGDGERVYVTSEDGTIIALDADTGEQLWTQTASSEVHVAAVAGFGAVVVRSADGRVVTLEPETGAERWSASFTPPALTLNGYSTPVLVDGGVLVGLDDGRIIAMALDTGRVIWEAIVSVPTGRSEIERLVDIDGDIQVDDEAIYLSSYRGRIVRIEPGQGNIVWSTPMSSTAGVLVGNEKVYVVNEEDSVLEVDKITGEIGWEQNALRGRSLTRPVAVSNSTLMVADFEGYLHLIDAKSGELVGRSRVGKRAITTTPTQVEGITYVQSSDGALAAVRLR